MLNLYDETITVCHKSNNTITLKTIENCLFKTIYKKEQSATNIIESPVQKCLIPFGNNVSIADGDYIFKGTVTDITIDNIASKYAQAKPNAMKIKTLIKHENRNIPGITIEYDAEGE